MNKPTTLAMKAAEYINEEYYIDNIADYPDKRRPPDESLARDIDKTTQLPELLDVLRRARGFLYEWSHPMPSHHDDWQPEHSLIAEIDSLIGTQELQMRMPAAVGNPPSAIAYAAGHHDTDPDGLG
jgi:hypothetical protein